MNAHLDTLRPRGWQLKGGSTKAPAATRETLGQRLKRIRLARKLSIPAAAKAAGNIHPKTVKRHEDGDTTVGETALVGYARAYDVSVDELTRDLVEDS